MLATLARPKRGASVDWSPLDARWYQEIGGNRADAGPVIVPEAALSVAVLYRALNVLAHAVASIPLVIYERTPDGKSDAPDHPQYDLLHRQPNAWMTSFRWRHLAIIQSYLWGNHYSQIMPGRGGIGQTVPLNPDTTRIVDQLNDGRLLYVTRDSTAQGFGPERKLLQDDVFHLRGFSLDGKTGIPLTRLAKNAIGLALVAERHGSMFLKRGARFNGFLTGPSLSGTDASKNLEEAWQRANGGSNGTGNTPYLGGGVDFKQMQADNRNSQWIEARSFQVEEMLRFTGVPGVLCGYADKTATYASAEQFFLSFVTNTVHPVTENFSAELNCSVVTGAPQYFAEFVLEGLLKGDIKTRYTAHQMAILSGWKNRNEVRVEESYNRGPDALDEYLEPLNMAQAGTQDTGLDNTNTDTTDSTDTTDTSTDTTDAKRQLKLIARNSVERLVRKEMSAIAGSGGKLGAAARFAGNADGWKDWLATFYGSHATAIVTDLGVSDAAAAMYCTAQRNRFSCLTPDTNAEHDSIAALLRLTPAA